MWKTIQNEPAYEINDSGQVRNIDTKHVKSTRNGKRGYERVTLYPSGKTYHIHRLVAETFLIKNSQQVNHINGNKLDNRVENLEWCSAKQNINHAIENGLMKLRDWSGHNNPNYRGK